MEEKEIGHDETKDLTSESRLGPAVSSVPGRDPVVVRQAVRSLRERFRETQQQFAARMGWAISTVVRYELSRAPKGKALAELLRLAAQNGFDDLAETFRFQLVGEYNNPDPFTRDEGEAVWIRAVLRIMRSSPDLDFDHSWVHLQKGIVAVLETIHSRMLGSPRFDREELAKSQEELLDARELLRIEEMREEIWRRCKEEREEEHETLLGPRPT